MKDLNQTVKESLTAQDHIRDATNMVKCNCGDLYPADSFGAGFIAATGRCQNCYAAEQAEQEPVHEALQIASVALQDIACSSQTENLYWWQLRARKAQKQIAECLTNAAPVEPVKQKSATWKCACGANLYIDSNGAPASKAEQAEQPAIREPIIGALKLADDLDEEFCQGRISNHNGRKAAQMIRLLIDAAHRTKDQK